MAKITFEEWKKKCEAFDPTSFRNFKAAKKAVSSLYDGFSTVRAAQVDHSEEMQIILKVVMDKHLN